MLRIAGYADRFSVHPGEEIRFYVNSERSESYDAEIVRLPRLALPVCPCSFVSHANGDCRWF